MYWHEWPLQKGRFIASGDEPQWNRHKIQLLESKLVWEETTLFTSMQQNKKNDKKENEELSDWFIGNQMVTRGKVAVLRDADALGAKVKITRNSQFESYLLNKQQSNIKSRRTICSRTSFRTKSILKSNRSKSLGGSTTSGTNSSQPQPSTSQQQSTAPSTSQAHGSVASNSS